ncbi:cellulose synthase catalytic subunit [Rhizobiaceae bacterium]|nr:cellulose synthase catalytic subunit [Rhizobiaceae bacterium]
MNLLSNPIFEAAMPGLALAFVCAAVLPWLDVRNNFFRTLLAACAVLVSGYYLTWRWTDTMPPLAFDADWIAGFAFFATEAVTIAGTAITFLVLSRTKNRSGESDANQAWLAERSAAMQVDVLICTYNEEQAILERTIMAATHMDHPALRVWVADDGKRQWLADLCEDLGCGYITRTDNSHAKAGNINNALAQLDRLEVAPDYVMVLDADFVPARSFLKRTLALFRDETVGLVQTPQHFVNADPIQSNLGAVNVWPDEQRFFFDIMMPAKDAWGAAFCCGTSSMIDYRRLRAVGGFATDSVTEDYLVTLKLQEAGHRTVYLNERISLGLAPEGLKEYITQRSRWCLGLMQIIRGPSGPFRPGNGLPFMHRLCLAETFSFWAGTHAFRIMCLLVPILYLVFDIHAVQADFADAVTHFLPYLVMQMAFVSWVSKGRVLPLMTDASQVLTAVEVMKSVFAGLWNPKGHGFKVTAKGGDRSKRMVQWGPVRLYLALIAMTIIGIIMSYVYHGGRPLESASMISLFWAWYNIIILVICCFVCIELPRPLDDLSTNQTISVRQGAVELKMKVLRAAKGSVVLLDDGEGAALLDFSEPATIGVEGEEFLVNVTASEAGTVTVRLQQSGAERARLNAALYASKFGSAPVKVYGPKVALAISKRIFN